MWDVLSRKLTLEELEELYDSLLKMAGEVKAEIRNKIREEA